MRNGAVNAVRNVKLVFISQCIVLLVSIIRTILIPKMLTVEDHGFWQTYLLYVSYISIFYLGFNDGVYLRYAKLKKREYIDRNFSSSIFVFFVSLIIEMLVVMLGVIFLANTKKIIYILVLINIPITGVLGTITYYLQLNNKMSRYAITVICEKSIFLLLLAISYFTKILSPYLFMIYDILSVLIITVIIAIKERKIILTLFPKLKEGFYEYKENIKVGSKVMIGTYVALLFTGICKFFVSATATIEQFSYYSFAISIANIVIVCLGVLGNAIYPHISKKETSKYGYYYDYINNLLNIIQPPMFMVYFLGSIFIQLVLPKYVPSLEYFGILFIVVMLQIKINVLNNTFYKLLREENRMLKDNIISLVQLVLGCLILKNIVYIILWQIVVMCYRVLRTSFYFRKKMGTLEGFKIKQFLFELLPYVIYSVSLFVPFYYGMCLYGAFVIVFCIIKRKELISLLKLFLGGRNEKNYTA